MKYYPQKLEQLILVFGDYLFGKIVRVTLLFFINSYKIIVGKYSIPQKRYNDASEQTYIDKYDKKGYNLYG
jgi:hypothetical protein